MPQDSLYARIVQGDEDALRESWRLHGRRACDLARRIAGPRYAATIVEEALLLIWTKPERWAADPLDLHVLRLTRDLALIVQRRGLGPRQAARELEPPPIRFDAESSRLAALLDHELSQRMLLELSDARRTALEAAWFEGASPAQLAGLLRCSEAEALDALNEALEQFNASMRELE